MRKRDDGLLAVLVALVLIVVVTVGIVAWAAGHSTRSITTVTVTSAAPTTSAPVEQVEPAVAAGAHDFVQFACAQCHGEQGTGGVSPDVPALTEVGKEETVAQLRHIIDHGLGESANPTKPYMPVWGEVISNQQVSDLVAYLRAGLPTVPDASPTHSAGWRGGGRSRCCSTRATARSGCGHSRCGRGSSGERCVCG